MNRIYAAAAIAIFTLSPCIEVHAADNASNDLGKLPEDSVTRSIIGGADSHFAVEAVSDKTTATMKIGHSWSTDGVRAKK